MLSKKQGAYNWNQAIKPEINAAELFAANPDKAKELRNQGFGLVLSHQRDGIVRGTGVLALLADDATHKVIVTERASAHYSLSKGSSRQDYPSSLMGSIALLRQTYLDAQWYAATKGNAEYNLSLDRMNQLQGKLPQIFESSDRLTTLRADKIGDEFGTQYIIKGSGDEYMRLDDLKTTNAAFIIPVKYPKAYDVQDPWDALNINLTDLKHWELAPTNPAALAKAGFNFALTSADLKETSEFSAAIAKAVKNGLTHEQALKALTFSPANILGIYNLAGSLENNKFANFLITSDSLFKEKTIIYENWSNGKRYIIKDPAKQDMAGFFALNIGTENFYLEAKAEKPTQAPKLKIWLNDSTSIDVDYIRRENGLSLQFNAEKDSMVTTRIGKGLIRLSGWLEKEGNHWRGEGQLPNGKWVKWEAEPTAERPRKKQEKEKEEGSNKKNEEATTAAKSNPDKKTDTDKTSASTKKTDEPQGEVFYPFMAYGYTKAEQPKAETVVFEGVTVWTNEAEGIITGTNVMISNGKIAAIGRNLKIPDGAKVYDVKGKHLTAGIIDEHSHIAISRGVNEGTQASSAEVSIATVVNSEDVNIYRCLAGGVVAAQLLHGSANPIGGQAAMIKLRWGLAPEAMKIANADGFIKFALGENVKQSNWGDFQRERFPQTRMGVEQVYVDHFTRAHEYGEKLKNAGKKGASPVRRDLELDALLEIINKKRFITCHSYVQSEITMLMRVAEQFGFNINTFTHILEGYKVADKMKAHGVNASSFADWWAYKYEVYDAIPYNGAILNKVGVNTGFNSDDAEMARRLNQEAAKAVRYGGISEEEAWKFVTLNPAKMLHLDDRMGSIKVGKDADIVLWSDNPLSIYAKAEQTYVDGVCYFDIERDKQLREKINMERNRIVQKMLKAKNEGEQTQKGGSPTQKMYHCDDVEDEGHYNEAEFNRQNNSLHSGHQH
ncbi:MAG: amidohydrolase family protein [Chitinophagales bacterium]|nr:amidohydrolase family protein [Chitinophagales bacterium]MCC7058242.1 amidohydrolase family protein [Chitinophagales bacterium]